MLQREVLDAQFAGMKQALEGQDPEAMQQVKDMLADLNALLAEHARNEDTTDAFAEFMDKHGEFFPEQPETVEELIDALARRQAAAQRMMNSLSPEQREQLAQLMQQALSDADLASEMAQLSDNLRALRPGLDRASPTGMGQGGQPLGYGEAVEAVAEIADLEALRTSCPRTARARPSTTSTSTCWRSDSAATPWPTCRGCATWSASWSGRATCTRERRRAPADPAGRPSARPDRPQAGVRPARGDRPRRPRGPPYGLGRRATGLMPTIAFSSPTSACTANGVVADLVRQRIHDVRAGP